ncbi:hypothetical protein M6D93_07685 [Jatrophihabitans telluris]|uniref:DUF2007 domain-containing protein n=1 Tax=Jatrophihabitans telluris TaxID=2038343 RepID=A0ABY4R4V5_9ACTN|nr:hypothetical protein [Jatrophihabitans telluris]UQX89874.1 hypothetical protein M6D93_07685 [Jatrophihabitans telluris]
MGFDLSVPITAFVVAVMLAFVVRWVFKPSRPRTGRPAHGPGADLGMLTAVLGSAGRSQALTVKNRLSAGGVRCTVSRLDANHYDVLVFTADADKARRLLEG